MKFSLEGWRHDTPRPEIAPHFSLQAAAANASAALIIECADALAWGAWRKSIKGIVAGRRYVWSAFCRTSNVAEAKRGIGAQLNWLDKNGHLIDAPAFAAMTEYGDDWARFQGAMTAPPAARGAEIALSFGWNARARIAWSDIEWRAEAMLPEQERVVRAATIYHRPRKSSGRAHNVEAFCHLIAAADDRHPDIICLPEGITLIGTGLSYAQVCEPLDGPTAKRLGEAARRGHCYIVAGIFERDGKAIYNTAILIGRDGKLIGSYRKTHLPREEVEGGLTPGGLEGGPAYPVFQTDFGVIGIMICWDLQFPEAARALALRGAEMIFLPIWGGSDLLARARAIENHVFLIASSYDMRSVILDPSGAILAEATPAHPCALAAVFLDRPLLQPWLGDMKWRTWKERRVDLASDPDEPLFPTRRAPK